MSVKEPLGDYYADTAYTPAKRQQWETENPKRDTIIGSRLSWGRRTRDNGTNEEYGYNNIAISESWKLQRAEKGLEGDDIFKEMKVHYDHQRIMPPYHAIMTKFIHVAMAFGVVFFYMSLATFLLLFLIFLYYWLFGGNDVGYFFLQCWLVRNFLFPLFLSVWGFGKAGSIWNKNIHLFFME